MEKFSTEHTTTAHSSAISSSSQPGRPIGPSHTVTDQLVSAPTISTSPCAKLMRLTIP